MGCWSVYCDASKLPLSNKTKAVLLPIVYARGMNDLAEYVPATLPIVGDYDDYGGLENIITPSELITETYDVTIQEFVKKLIKGEYHEKGLDYMWFRKDVYDIIVNIENKYNIPIWLEYILKELGYKLKTKTGIKNIYIHENGSTLNVNGISVSNNNNKYFHCVKDFKSENVDVAKYENYSFLDFWWPNRFNCRDDVSYLLEWNWKMSKDLKILPIITQIYKESKTKSGPLDEAITDYYEHVLTILNGYFGKLAEKIINNIELAQESENLTKFSKNCFKLNIKFTPYINHGPQDPDLESLGTFYNEIVKVLNQEKKENDE